MFEVFSLTFLRYLFWWHVTTLVVLSSIVVAVVIIMLYEIYGFISMPPTRKFLCQGEFFP
jgi:hypothetical protein